MSEPEQLLRRAYDAFNSGDIDAALALMHPEVDWANGMEGGVEHGRDAVRAYWTRQWAQIDPKVEPEAFGTDDEGFVTVDVRQVVHDREGNLVSEGQVLHIYAFEDGLVRSMEIVELG